MERTEDSYFIKLKFSLSVSLSSCKAVILRLRTPNICPSEFLVGKECETMLIAKAPFKFPTQVGWECKAVCGLNHCFTVKKMFGVRTYTISKF